jgi:hypothetical protein
MTLKSIALGIGNQSYSCFDRTGRPTFQGSYSKENWYLLEINLIHDRRVIRYGSITAETENISMGNRVHETLVRTGSPDSIQYNCNAGVFENIRIRVSGEV